MTTNAAGWGDLDALLRLADALADEWAARGAASTTHGQERAILRLCGVGGLDRAGRPLASAVVERYLGRSPTRLAGGVLLPFAVALLEYDVSPQDLAMDVASGAVDLALEAQLLEDPERRRVAQEAAARLAAMAADRVDANRTARLELIGVLGEPPAPWIGATLAGTELEGARAEAVRLVDGGADLVRVGVPAGRELSARAESRGASAELERDTGTAQAPADPGRSRLRRGMVPYGRPAIDGVPAGSQRGLAELRLAIDQAAAEGRRYVRLATVGPALAGPELAVVAGFERIDVVEMDAIAEIVDEGVDPARALADHAFACRLLRRAGAQVIVGPGPLVVAPELARGVPSDAGTRAGRALALQLLSVALARRHGLARDQILVGALPAWITDERDPTIQAIAQVALRRELFPGHAFVFDEPAMSAASEGWPFVFAAAVPGSEPTGLVMRREEPGRVRQVGEATRVAARVGRDVHLALGPRRLHGPALDHARAVVQAGQLLLEGLRSVGWQAITGTGIDTSDRAGAGWDTVVERSEAFDPFGLDQTAAPR